jgi:hypothetical protein
MSAWVQAKPQISGDEPNQEWKEDPNAGKLRILAVWRSDVDDGAVREFF